MYIPKHFEGTETDGREIMKAHSWALLTTADEAGAGRATQAVVLVDHRVDHPLTIRPGHQSLQSSPTYRHHSETRFYLLSTPEGLSTCCDAVVFDVRTARISMYLRSWF